MRDNWYHHWVAGAMLDDQLWHQALVMDRVLELLRGSKQGPNDAMMWTLLCRGGHRCRCRRQALERVDSVHEVLGRFGR